MLRNPVFWACAIFAFLVSMATDREFSRLFEFLGEKIGERAASFAGNIIIGIIGGLIIVGGCLLIQRVMSTR